MKDDEGKDGLTTRTPLQAIRLKCLDCTCQQPKEIRECTITSCPLHPFRFGTNPNLTGKRGRGRSFGKKSTPLLADFKKESTRSGVRAASKKGLDNSLEGIRFSNKDSMG